MANVQYYDVILKPVITEKSMNAMGDKKYTFFVHPEATKTQIKEAVEKMFEGTKVKSVNTMNIDGSTKITTIILLIPPLAIRIHSELIISIFEYNPTPTVAAKKLSALTMIDCADARCAVVIASYFSAP